MKIVRRLVRTRNEAALRLRRRVVHSAPDDEPVIFMDPPEELASEVIELEPPERR